jgi:cytochrome c oxidase subunit II
MRIGTTALRSMATLSLAGLAATLATAAAAQQAGDGVPHPWGVGLQNMATELGQDAASFHTYLVWLIALISLFVAGLLVAIIVKFSERQNPTPSRTTHNTLLEVAWTVVPVLILVAIAIPSFRLLREQLVIPKHDLVVKATGFAWYWGYEYPADQGGGFKFDSNMIEAKDLKPGQPRLLAVDNDMVVPVGKVVRMQVTAADVLHSFAVPAFGFKLDAIPGRLNEMWFRADREGVYYGQCSELCGNGHPYMPITVRVVSEAAYSQWLQEAKTKYASTGAPARLATAQ